MGKKQIKDYKFVPGLIPPDANQYPNAVNLITANKEYIVETTEKRIKSGELSSDTTLEEIRSWISDDSDIQIEFVNKKTNQKDMLKIIEISISEKIVNSKLDLIEKHLEQIKTLMKYADVEEVGILKKRINDD